MSPAPPSATPLLFVGFVVLSLALVIAFVLAVHRATGQRARTTAIAALGAAGWLTLSGGLAATGRLAFGPLPPPLMIFFTLGFVGTLALALSPLGKRLALRLPLWVLVGYQSFRIVVELLLHRAHVEHLAPVQITYLGWNYDILTGLSALVVAGLVLRGGAGPALVWVWNLAGLALLAIVVGTAVLSAPTPLQVFASDPPNTWITHFPFIWLPAVMVACALLGHLLVFRRLLAMARDG